LQATQKKSEVCPSNHVSTAAMTFESDENGGLSVVFSVQRTRGSPTQNRVDDQDTGSPGKPVSSGLQVPGEPGHCRALVTFPWRFSFQMPFSCIILRVDSLAFWKITNEEDAVLIPKKNRGENISSGFLHSEFLGVG
jgi:hypothetical protein